MNQKTAYSFQSIDWIHQLNLMEHPEGGYYRRTFCATEMLEKTALPNRFTASRPLVTAIYYLLESHQFSAFHRIKSDEIWHFYSGSSLTLYSISEDGHLVVAQLGNNPENDEKFQIVIPSQHWFAACVNQPNSYSLVGCVVSPGFDFSDFELATQADLLRQYPQHRDIVIKLTKS